MKSKIIKSVLSKKVKDWLSSVKDEKLKAEMEKGIIITGGSIVSLLTNEKVNDFDVYFKSKELVLKVARYYSDIFNTSNKYSRKVEVIDDEDENRVKFFIKSSGVVAEDGVEEITEEEKEALDIVEENEGDDKKDKYRPIFFTGNSITLSDKIQIVIRFWGNPEELHTNFDFLHCTCYWQSWDNKLELPAKALECIINKNLVYVGSKYPVCSVIRLRKFIKRGWQASAGQIFKILFQISFLDLTDIKVLEDQLTGVDSAYFMQLIEILTAKKEENKDFQFNSSYVNTILDRIFE